MSGVVRFSALLGVLACCAAVAAAAPSRRPPTSHASPVALENRLPGTAAWRSGWEVGHELEGYASEVSLSPGETLHLHVSVNPAGAYRIEVYRLGWYHGLGGRLYACVPSCTSTEPGSPRPVPPYDPNSGLVDANWPVTDRLPIGREWLSGYYLAVLRVPDRQWAYRIPFIVKAPPGRHAAILVQASTNTWQAYNDWGGRSLYYPDMQGVIDNHVSFDRPYAVMPMTDESEMRFELPLLRFLERSGFDLSYQADSDTDANPSSLLEHDLVIVAGHDEYQTQGERDALTAARDAGVNLAFMGANIGYWRIRYEDNRRTIVEYRRAARDPLQLTDKFRRLLPPQPECQLEGVQFDDGDGTASIGGPPHDLTVADTASSWFRHTGLHPGDLIANLASAEWDHRVPGCTPADTIDYFSYQGPPSNDDVTSYRAPSGATVFAAGSLMFNFALDDTPDFTPQHGWQNPGLQRFIRNMLQALARRRS
jgi:hypothetical protein